MEKILNNAVIALKKAVCPSDWEKSYIFSKLGFVLSFFYK